MNKMAKLTAIQEIIADLSAQVKPQATGHIRTAISVLREEEQKLMEEIESLVA